jgi:deoxyribodipyrimidine photo-lyase
VPAPTLWWIRRDLRLADNPALEAALARGGPVVPVFIRDPVLLAAPAHRHAARRLAFLHGGLRALGAALGERGARLVVRSGAPAAVLAQLVRETGAAAVVAERDVSPYARRRDDAVARAVPLALVDGLTVHPPGTLRTGAGRPYTVFSPYRRAWLARPLPARKDLLPAPATLPSLGARLASELLPDDAPPAGFPPGEDEARRRLARFTRGARAPIRAYARTRDRLDLDGTSALSPYLRFGMVSARAALVAALGAGARPGARTARTGADVWLAELVWREFYLDVLWHFPYVLGAAFDPRLRRIAWRDAPDELRAWQEGRTGYPVIDAAMRQLAATGWIPNRARMLVASFLAKDLLLDWRAGEAWFMRHLVDGDPAANNGGWQWTAGTGTDAAPYFRVFSPVLQGRRFDPRGEYVRRWVPELGGVAGARVHEPWRLSAAAQQAAGAVLGRDYPAPIVDHGEARTRALAAFARARRPLAHRGASAATRRSRRRPAR